jgi:mRNA deadenylase 3'-5' endonuclease subunit Ccr4
MRELEEAQGDIVCLQEVQADHFDAHLKPFMDSLGYEGLYKMKSRDFGGQFSKVRSNHRSSCCSMSMRLCVFTLTSVS